MTQVTITYDDAEWQLVPKRPDQAMCQAGQDRARQWPSFPLRIVPIFQDMLAAAPQPTAQAAPVAMTDADRKIIFDAMRSISLNADALRECHTSDGKDWGDDSEAKADYEADVALLDKLREIHARAAAQADSPAITADETGYRLPERGTTEFGSLINKARIDANQKLRDPGSFAWTCHVVTFCVDSAIAARAGEKS